VQIFKRSKLGADINGVYKKTDLKCFSLNFTLNQSWALVVVEFEWFFGQIVAKIGLHRGRQHPDGWKKAIHRRVDWNWFACKIGNMNLALLDGFQCCSTVFSYK
jgi:hypothetical protein